MDINTQIAEVIKHYPSLTFSEANNCFTGELFASEGDSYDVRIELGFYPKYFPNVYEISERIPCKADRHIYTDSGSCCFTTKAKAQILLQTKISSLYLFVREIVVPYLQNNSYFEIHKKYKSEEYSHGVLGILEGYMDILLTNNTRAIIQLLLDRINAKGKIRIHDTCYCGSGLPIKKCTNGKHYQCYKQLRLIDIELIQNDLLLIYKTLQS
jgi:hypothetical protein